MITVLTSGWNEVSIWDEEFIAIMFFQHIREDLQGKAFLFPGFLTPLVRVNFGVGQVCIIVFVFCIKPTERNSSKECLFKKMDS